MDRPLIAITCVSKYDLAWGPRLDRPSLKNFEALIEAAA